MDNSNELQNNVKDPFTPDKELKSWKFHPKKKYTAQGVNFKFEPYNKAFTIVCEIFAHDKSCARILSNRTSRIRTHII